MSFTFITIVVLTPKRGVYFSFITRNSYLDLDYVRPFAPLYHCQGLLSLSFNERKFQQDVNQTELKCPGALERFNSTQEVFKLICEEDEETISETQNKVCPLKIPGPSTKKSHFTHNPPPTLHLVYFEVYQPLLPVCSILLGEYRLLI